MEYGLWRDKAILALHYAQRESAFIKGWVREKTDIVMLSDKEIIGSDPESLLREAFKSLKRIASLQENKLERRDHAIIAAIEREVLK
jgi:pyruvate kinase